MPLIDVAANENSPQARSLGAVLKWWLRGHALNGVKRYLLSCQSKAAVETQRSRLPDGDACAISSRMVQLPGIGRLRVIAITSATCASVGLNFAGLSHHQPNDINASHKARRSPRDP